MMMSRTLALIGLSGVVRGFFHGGTSTSLLTMRMATYADFEAAETAALASCKAGDYEEALELFELALTLPGDGYDVRRVNVKTSPINGATVPRDLEEVRFASLRQKQTTLYNMACVKAKLGEDSKALDDLEKALSIGFDDYHLIRDEDDFKSIAKDAQKLIEKYKPKGIMDQIASFNPLRPKN